MAGCTKADRKRKSASNTSYKAGNRKDVNSRKKQQKHLSSAKKILKVARGTARKIARVKLQREIIA